MTKSSRYLFFDLGVRRVLSGESRNFFSERKGELFEHLIGNELIKWIHCASKGAKLYFWRDPDGPEIDWLVEYDGRLLPIEVKIKSNPDPKSVRHLKTFMSEYSSAKSSLVISTTDIKYKLDSNTMVIPYQNLHAELSKWKNGN